LLKYLFDLFSSTGRLKTTLPTAVVLMLLAGSLAAEEPVIDWLTAMGGAMRNLNYEGELVYRRGGLVDVLQMVHTVRKGVERERITALNGVPREVIRDDNAVVCILPESKAVSFDQRSASQGFPRLSPLAVEDLALVYDIRSAGDDRIAGRAAKVIDIQPKDAFRYARRIYLDQKHRLPLRLDMLDEAGEMVVTMMFSRLRVNDKIPFKASQPSIHSDGYTLVRRHEMDNPRKMSPFQWTFGDLPKGFRVTRHDVRRDEVGGEWREQVILSDGLATVSVYIEKDRPKERLEGASSMGAVSLFGRRNQAGHVTVVGEVPARTVRAIAEAVDFSQHD
jgi:sigma-E factor negative regulatory protein RseB